MLQSFDDLDAVLESFPTITELVSETENEYDVFWPKEFNEDGKPFLDLIGGNNWTVIETEDY